MMSGPKLPADTNIIQILFKRLTLKGSTLRSRTTEYQADLLQRFEKHALGLITEGKMKVEIHEVFPWDKVIEAQKEMEANKNSGKVGTLLEFIVHRMWLLMTRLCLRYQSEREYACHYRCHHEQGRLSFNSVIGHQKDEGG
jgi:hypothetical protein